MFTLIPAKHIRPIVTQHHYLHRFPAVPIYCFAWVESGVPTAACVFGLSAARSFGKHVIELQRLVRGPDYTGPQLTKFLAACFRHIRSGSRRVDGIVSFADAGVGHHGGIYQAFNGVYVGTSAGERSYRHAASGRILARRAMCHEQKKTGCSFRDYEKLPMPVPKHLYVWPIKMKLPALLVHLKRSQLPYPKPTQKTA